MAINSINDINSYVVNELFKDKTDKNDSTSVISGLQTLSEKYAEISAFGKKLNEIYTTLSQSNADSRALEGARDVILSFVNSSSTDLDWMETVNRLDTLKNNNELFENFFSTANLVKEKTGSLSAWLTAFNGIAQYGFEDDFINQTNTILNSDNSELAADTFEKFLNTLNDILSSSPNEGITRQSLSTFFSGLSSATTLGDKNDFITNFKAG
ncbi:hypothetical protein [Hippea alviniae]|uniref:hypothetical protein n=1 Tax=Hippea alviniae TaxID=1279027 RepID=UPI0003B5F1E4|nr:hypothetical protein [Hippea alviniae]